MSEPRARGRLGVDVGGTFTDLLLVDQASGAMRIAKVPSTPADQSDGFMAGLAALGDAADGFETVVHGTTVGTNAVLERKGVRCALITTQGFRDTLELGRRTRPNPWGMFGSFEPIVPRERRFEITERIDASGAVVTALDEEEVRAAVQASRAAGAEALVVHFIHAYLNPDHERRAGDIAREVWARSPDHARLRHPARGARVRARQHRRAQRLHSAHHDPAISAASRPGSRRAAGRVRAAGDAGQMGA